MLSRVKITVTRKQKVFIKKGWMPGKGEEITVHAPNLQECGPGKIIIANGGSYIDSNLSSVSIRQVSGDVEINDYNVSNLLVHAKLA